MAGVENIHDKKKPQQKKTKHNETKRRTNTRGFIEIILFFKLLGLKKMETLWGTCVRICRSETNRGLKPRMKKREATRNEETNKKRLEMKPKTKAHGWDFKASARRRPTEASARSASPASAACGRCGGATSRPAARRAAACARAGTGTAFHWQPKRPKPPSR